MLYYYLTSSNLLILSKPKKSNKMKKGYASLDGTAPEPSKNRLLYGILALLIGLAVGFFLFSGNSSQPKHTDKLPNVIPNIAPEPKPEKPDPKAEKTIPKPEEKDLDPPLKLPDTKIVTSFKIVKTYKREGRQFYTQGLTFKDKDTLLESAGLYGESEVHYVSIPDMSVSLDTQNPQRDFGEGATFFNNFKDIIQLTWRERNMYIYDAQTMKLKKSLIIPAQVKEGWGIARRDTYVNGEKVERLYVTDGSDSIHILDTENFSVLQTIKAYTRGAEGIWNLNELEFVEGKLWANVYLSTQIAIIDPDTGFVEAYFKAPELLNLARKEGGAKEYGDCLNGIAYHEETKQLVLTGKRWPVMWQITVEGYAPGE